MRQNVQQSHNRQDRRKRLGLAHTRVAELGEELVDLTRGDACRGELDRDHVELNQLLKLVGLADSGGQGKAIVASGDVTVDGVVELRKTAKIRAGQIVRVGDAEIRVRGVEG